MADEQIIKNRESGEVLVGSGPVPEGWDVVGPAQGVGPVLGPPSEAQSRATLERNGASPGLASGVIGKIQGFDRAVPGGLNSLGPLGMAVSSLTDAADKGSEGSLVNLAKTGALPTAGGIAGGALGGRFGMPGRIAGEAVGNTAGTAGNMALGIEPWSGEQLGIAAGLPAVARGIGGALAGARSLGAKMLPGSSVARHEAGAAAMEAIPGSVLPKQPSEPLFNQLAKQNPMIQVPQTMNAVGEVLGQQAMRIPSLMNKAIVGIGTDLKDMVAHQTAGVGAPARDPQMAFQNLWANMKGLRAAIDGGIKDGSIESGQAIKIRSAILGDLDTAANSASPGSQAASLLKAANESFRKEMASESLGDVIKSQGMGLKKVGNSDVIELRPTKVLEWLRKDPDKIAQHLAPEEKVAIEDTLRKIQKNSPALPPPESAYGSVGRLSQNLSRMAVGGALGGFGGSMIGGAAGGSVGLAAGAFAAQKAGDILQQALLTPTGRKLLLSAMDRGPFMDHAKMAALAMALRNPLLAEQPDTNQAPGPTKEERKIIRASQ